MKLATALNFATFSPEQVSELCRAEDYAVPLDAMEAALRTIAGAQCRTCRAFGIFSANPANRDLFEHPQHCRIKCRIERPDNLCADWETRT